LSISDPDKPAGPPGVPNPYEATLKFEIAPPGKLNEFKTYIEASADRK
jgi:hypothetical protein